MWPFSAERRGFPLSARPFMFLWVEPAGGEQKSADVERKTVTPKMSKFLTMPNQHFFLALIVVELLAIFFYFSQYKNLPSISGTPSP
jgi:hypothetical protein